MSNLERPELRGINFKRWSEEECRSARQKFADRLRGLGYAIVKHQRFSVAYQGAHSKEERAKILRIVADNPRDVLIALGRILRGNFILLHAVPGQVAELTHHSVVEDHAKEFGEVIGRLFKPPKGQDSHLLSRYVKN